MNEFLPVRTDAPSDPEADLRYGEEAAGPLMALRSLADGWSGPDALHLLEPGQPFPLRRIAGDGIIAYLLRSNRFSVRDRKILIPAMDLDLDPRDASGFYEAYLDVVERDPQGACLLEFRLFRIGGNWRANTRILRKPVSGLRLDALPRNAWRLEDLGRAIAAGDLLPPEPVLGFFYDHAIRSYDASLRASREGDVEIWLGLMRRVLPGDQEPPVFFDEEDDEEDDGCEIGGAREERDPEDGNADGSGSERPVSDLAAFLEAKSRLLDAVSDLDPESPPDAFLALVVDIDRISKLAARARVDPEVEEIAEALAARGIGSAPENARWIRAADDKTVARDVVETFDALGAARDRSLDVEREARDLAGAAMADGDYDRAQSVLMNAQRAGASAKACEAKRQDLRKRVARLIPDATDLDASEPGASEDSAADVDAPIDALRALVRTCREMADTGPSQAMPAAEARPGGAEPHVEEHGAGTSAPPADPSRPAGDGEAAPAPSGPPVASPAPRPGPRREAQGEEAQGVPQKEPQKEPQKAAHAAGRNEGDETSDALLARLLADAPDAARGTLLLADLISAEAFGLAEELADDLPGRPMARAALRTASLSRGLDVAFSPEVERLGPLVAEAAQVDLDELSAMVLFVSGMQTAIFVPHAQVRGPISGLSLGSFGAALGPLQSSIGQLEYHFSPAPEDLARLAGAPREPRRTRILRRLDTWERDVGVRSGPCVRSTKILREIARGSTDIGAALAAMRAGAREAETHALRAVERYGTLPAMVASLREDTDGLAVGATVRLPRVSQEYLFRQIDPAMRLFADWIAARPAAETHDHRRDDAVRRTVELLLGQIRTASGAIAERAGGAGDTPDGRLVAAVARFAERRLAITERALRGEDVSLGAVDPLVDREYDRLQPDVRTALLAGRRGEALEILLEDRLPDVEEAIVLHRGVGNFATAGRLGGEADVKTLLSAQAISAAVGLEEARTQLARATIMSRFDIERQERYPALRRSLADEIERLTGARVAAEAGAGPEALEDIEASLLVIRGAQVFLEAAEETVRSEQERRVADLRNAANVDDAETLLDQIRSGAALESIESKIALLRDGRSIGLIADDDGGPIGAFAPAFVRAAGEAGWPLDRPGYAEAFAGDGPLAVPEGRRKAAESLLGAYFDLSGAVAGSGSGPARGVARGAGKGSRNGSGDGPVGTAPTRQVVSLLQELGFAVSGLDDETRIQGARAWSFGLRAAIPRSEDDRWFLPPDFGSRARGAYRLVVADGAVLPEVMTQPLATNEPAILVVTARLDAVRRREIATRLRGAGQPAILIDETLLAFAALRRETRLETVFSCGLPYGRVEPYLTDATVLPPEMFFGRRDEIRRIMAKNSEGCLVYGGRQLGKSALLSHIEQTRHAPAEGVVVVRDQVTSLGAPTSPAANIWTRLHAKLSECGADVVSAASREDRDRTCQEIRLWLSQDSRRRVIVLFDETDEFVSAETTTGFPEITRLKDLMESTDRAFKVVFAGLHNVQRLHNVVNSPLAHLGDPIVIGPLNKSPEDKRAAYDLVVEPMKAAGFRYESAEAPDKILAYANDYPSLVQEFAKGLLSQIHRTGGGKVYEIGEDGPLWTIPDRLLFDHETFARIQENIRKKFRWTLDLDVRYALVAYTLSFMAAEGQATEVLTDGLSPRQILDQAMTNWPRTTDPLDVSVFEVILDEMYDLGILGRINVPGTTLRRYCLRSPEIAAILGGWEDAVEELLKIRAREGKPTYDPATYRRSVEVREKRVYLPLTDFQVDRMLGKRGEPGARLVCGWKMLGLGKIARTLQRVQNEQGFQGVRFGRRVRIETATSIKEFRARMDAPMPRDTDLILLIYDGEKRDEIERLLGYAENHQRVRGGGVRPVFLLDAADPRLRDLATSRASSLFLSPWGEGMLRMHLRQTEAPTELDAPAIRARLLRATGGIPDYIVAAVRRLRDAPDRDLALAEIDDHFASPQVLGDPDLQRKLEPLTVTESPEEYAMLDEDVRASLGVDLETLVPDLRAMGLVSRWSPQNGIFEPSVLNDFLRSKIE